jgi:YHS domain-containing protein
MRAIIILILITVAIALVRMLIRDVFKAVGKSMGDSTDDSKRSADNQKQTTTGRLVKDPETGSYVDERTALKTEIKGQTYYFESTESRDAYLRKNR